MKYIINNPKDLESINPSEDILLEIKADYLSKEDLGRISSLKDFLESNRYTLHIKAVQEVYDIMKLDWMDKEMLIGLLDK